MANLAASVVDGVLQQTKEVEKKTIDKQNELGKDSFLQLLVCQMQNQDPLEPTSDTEWISQLATYSELEQMQNMNQGMTNTQAFSLVGQQVIVNTTDSDGNDKTISGMVDYVSITKGKAYLSIEGELYPMDDLKTVLDYEYLINNCSPSVTETTETIDLNDLKDVTFKVDMGKDIGEATAIAIILNDEVIKASYVKLDEKGNVTISKEAFKGLETGTYTPTIVFNNSLNTTINGKLLINVTNSAEEGDSGTPEDDSQGKTEETA